LLTKHQVGGKYFLPFKKNFNERYIDHNTAENPRATDKNFVFVLFVKIARALPTPVDKPAKSVNPNAMSKVW
jgi:hypothetical protein